MKTKLLKAKKAIVDLWKLQLYVMGQSAKSVTALANLTAFCEDHLKGHYRITVIDLQKQPERARQAQILAVPTVIRALPKPTQTMIGDFSHTERLLERLDLRLAH